MAPLTQLILLESGLLMLESFFNMPALTQSQLTEPQLWFITTKLPTAVHFIWSFGLKLGISDSQIQRIAQKLRDWFDQTQWRSPEFLQMFLFRMIIFRRDKMEQTSFDTKFRILLEEENLNQVLIGLPASNR